MSAASLAQSGILLEGMKFAIFIEARILDYSGLGSKCQQFLSNLKTLQTKNEKASLGAVVAFGHDSWKSINKGQGGSELINFVPLGNDHISAPSTQRDMFIHIQSLHFDIVFTLAMQASRIFGPSIKVEEEVHGFRWEQERDTTGFIDGTENPKGEKDRADAAIVPDGPDKGGSYILSQRFVHDLKSWEKLAVHTQEKDFGRTKEKSVELPLDKRNPGAHVTKTDLGDKVVRQSLPYGKATTGEVGLYFLSYAKHLSFHADQLKSMFGGVDGTFDQILNFTKPVTGSYWFAPSLNQLNQLAKTNL
ncbi:Dyp-type peroxidase family protein [Cavenderia fasciculata]|uniref:Dyp-type peroxidase family protein n=1 Tax=Cavenderia fasciculata TaxID=261658 RepID=F4QDP1_CACFS|nr:Dyp-type peroxidase family protein [Cavenderia fasciculata]EGG13838.1 Dyp-type peroxidase family protein [Cavenderia fasciculata]|eukprot:XP_004350546.1 Dyp-type peroxidase family protein [Cavenderia fasciculata]